MKNINYVINGVLAIAIIVLYVLHFSAPKESKITRTFTAGNDSTALLPIAYVNVDSLLLNYNYSKDLNEIILKKQENSRANITQKARSLQSEMQDFQRKVENNAFLTRERAEQEQQRLIKKQQELQDLDNQLFSNTVGDNILLAGEVYDITADLLEYLNKSYSSPQK